jgi:membrane protein
MTVVQSARPRAPFRALSQRWAMARLRLLRGWVLLRRWPWLDTARTLRQRFREDHLGLTASSLTFTTTIALVPLATVAFAVFSAYPMFGTFRKSLEHLFIQNLVPDTIARPVLTMLTQFALKANRLGAVGLVALVFTALALMLTIDRTLNGIWRVRKPRPIAQRILVYWSAATLGPLLLGVSLSLTSYAVSASRGLVDAMPGGVSLVLNSLEIALVAAAFAALYRYVPNTYVKWTHAWAGGAFVSLGLEVAKKVLAWYLGAVPTFSTIYGAFSAVPIFLVWLYLGWVIVLCGAVITAYAPSLTLHVPRRPETPEQRLSLALAVLRQLDQARAHGQVGAPLVALAAELQIDPLQVEPVVDLLIDIGWVGRLEEAGAQRHVLLVDPALTSVAPLLHTFVLAREASLEPFWQALEIERLPLARVLHRVGAAH